MSTGEMFVMLFIYVAPFNYSFVYLFMEELTEIGKFIFAEGHLAPLYPLPTQRERRGWHIRLVSNCFMWSFLRLTRGCHFHPSRWVSWQKKTDWKRDKWVEAERWKEHQRESRDENNSVLFSYKTYNLACSEGWAKVTCSDMWGNQMFWTPRQDSTGWTGGRGSDRERT